MLRIMSDCIDQDYRSRGTEQNTHSHREKYDIDETHTILGTTDDLISDWEKQKLIVYAKGEESEQPVSMYSLV